jgi:predicted double-glycine peptidase
MHVLAAFVIIIAFYSGFHPINDAPKNELMIATDGTDRVKVRETVTSLEELKKQNIVQQTYDYSCGSAALATLLNYHFGEDFDERQVIQGLLKHGDSEKIAQRRAFSLLDMKRFVRVLGYKGVGYKAEYEDLVALDRPCILPIKIFGYRHFAVFRGIHKDHVFLADPWRGNISFTRHEFLEKWYQNVIFIVYPEGAREIALLTLTEGDLRFIDEDDARKIVFDPALNVRPPVDRWIDNRPGTNQVYSR